MEPFPAPSHVSPGMHDIGIQCCFDPITQRSVAIQTDSYKASAPVHARLDKVLHDHSYAMRAPPDIVFPTFDADSFTIPLPLLEHVENVAAADDESDVDANVDEEDEHLDPLWQIPDDELLSDNVFYDTQLKYLFPVINKAWEDDSRNQVDKLSS